LLAAGWTDDLWARSLMDSPPDAPQSLDADAKLLPHVSLLNGCEGRVALRRPTLSVPGVIPHTGPTALVPPEHASPPLTPRSRDPLFAFMSLQQ
jgi:hypothetical protein